MSTPNWITPSGLIGSYPALISLELQLIVDTVATYSLLSGSLPAGLTIRTDGLISGTPALLSGDITNTFVVRATSLSGNIADRTFSIRVTGVVKPNFTIPSGTPLVNANTTYDSVWIEIPVTYNNPIPDNPVYISILEGMLPPGLEINEFGLIRGYPEPPVTFLNYDAVETTAIATSADYNYITVISTTNIFVGRSIIFTGSVFGNIVSGKTYYVKSVVNASQIIISEVLNGDNFILSDSTGYMNVTLPATQVGEPARIQYSFTLQITSPNGSSTANYTITITNFNLPTSKDGPGSPQNSRPPTIYNTRPPTYNIQDSADYGYFVLPPVDEVTVPGETYSITQYAYMGQFLSDNYFAFKIIGHDFDGNTLYYTFTGLPSGLTGNSTTGWIYGTPTVPIDDIEEFSFSVKVTKTINSTSSPTFNYTVKIANNIDGYITWITDSDLGSINNASISYKYVEATCDVPLLYEIVDGELPPNLYLTANGNIEGTVAYQPDSVYKDVNDTNTFTFTIKAYNPNISVITSNRTFTLTVDQYYDIPTDNLYIKCTPSIADRRILDTLLTDTTIIPTDYLYRADDSSFGKASSVVYAHAYGIYTSTLQQYIEAIQKNHYWRSIILGGLKTATARDENGNIIYEVVYSNIIDNLRTYDPNYDYDYRYSTSVSEDVYWPRFIPLEINASLWDTSSTNIYTSYIFNGVDISFITNFRTYDMLTQLSIPLLLQDGFPAFYTSQTGEYVEILYPNSLENMKKRVSQELGADYNFKLLPLWMTSQQDDGNTLGFTPAWVICYTKPPFGVSLIADVTYPIDNTIEVSSTDNLIIGGQIVFSGNVFGGIVEGVTYYVIDIEYIFNIVSYGTTPTGYHAGTYTNHPTTCTTSDGTGLTVNYTCSATNQQLSNISINNLGTGYKIGDVINIVGGNASITIANFRIKISTSPTGTPLNLISSAGSMNATFYASYAELIKNSITNSWPYTLNDINFEIDRFTVNKQLTYNYNDQLNPKAWTRLPSATPTPDPTDEENFYVLFPQKTILPNKGQTNL